MLGEVGVMGGGYLGCWAQRVLGAQESGCEGWWVLRWWVLKEMGLQVVGAQGGGYKGWWAQGVEGAQDDG